jgi:hypothetical protein
MDRITLGSEAVMTWLGAAAPGSCQSSVARRRRSASPESGVGRWLVSTDCLWVGGCLPLWTIWFPMSLLTAQRAMLWRWPRSRADTCPMVRLATFETMSQGSFLPLVGISTGCVTWTFLEPILNSFYQHQGFGLISPKFLGFLFFLYIVKDICSSLYKVHLGYLSIIF